ncbi:S-layer homology domain-containing protein [Cloacibacillus evryensis]|uniref:S-layer homology domain-containing protein n=1 Tax=Cloacibacillus evryensis TaxID=508460 RepID=A0AAW5K854_9BACT|nr:S-layer homology domain-containing protein [Cloacibacillus evryensis]EHL68413.1 hypothetical protein HMPREF1006_02436 [Synergistes sp. 3_1_syn1]MCQ4814199.1 S-layer homology domain-containing protein [Cloacibacillus evryensis]
MKRLITVLLVLFAIAISTPSLAATNPFMDVPQGHWAYDAIGLLASRGIVSGYQNGTFKGGQTSTRYEIASSVARALAVFDADKADKQELELLKKLATEFKDELDTLGVQINKIDKRVATLEENFGGWKLRGQFRFSANFGGGDNKGKYSANGKHDVEFRKDRFRLMLTKQIDENTSFYAQFRGGDDTAGIGQTGRGDIPGFNIRDIYIDTKLPYDIDFRFGRFNVDFETERGLYIDCEPIFGDYRTDAFRFRKSWGNFVTTAIIGRNAQFDNIIFDSTDYMDLAEKFEGAYMNYVFDIFWQPNEKFFAGANGYWFVGDELENSEDYDFSTYGIYASYNLTPAIALQGIFYWQNQDAALTKIRNTNATKSNPTAWKAILDIKQDILKFSGLRFEYVQHDNTFLGYRNPYSFTADNGASPSIGDNMPWNDGSSTLFFIYASQKWSDKWSSYIRYQQADYDTEGLSNAKGYGTGITYQYTPAVSFRLAYDVLDYGEGNIWNANTNNGKDHVLQFRTTINF